MGKVIVALLVVAAAIGGWLLFQKMKLDGQAESFRPKLVEYETLPFPPAPEGVKDGTQKWAGGKVTASPSEMPRRSGKMVVVKPRAIDRSRIMGPEDLQPQVDAVWHTLKDEVRATSPEEAGTVVQVVWTLEDSQGYVDPNRPTTGIPGIPATQRIDVKAVMGKKVATLKVYDLKRQALVGTWRLEGDSPPDVVKPEDVAKLAGPPVKEFLEMMPGN